MSAGTTRITIDLSDEQLLALARLAGSDATRYELHSELYAEEPTDRTPNHTRAAIAVRWLVSCAADGLRRPGSWERGWLHQAFGSWPDPHESAEEERPT